MHLRIWHKITLTLAVIFAITLCGIYHYLHQSLTEDIFSRISANLTQQIILSRTFLEHVSGSSRGISNYDYLADEIGRDLNVRATIIASDGKVLGDSEIPENQIGEMENHSTRPEIQQARRELIGLRRRFSTTIKKEMLYMATQVRLGSDIGFVRLAIPLTELEETSARLGQLLVFSLIPAFIISVIIGALAARWLTRPLTSLNLTAKVIADGDLSRRFYFRNKDEIGELAASFNEMIDQLKQRIAESSIGRSRFEAVLMSMFEGVLVVDQEGKILLMNQSLRQMLKVTEEPVGRRPLEIIRNIRVQEILTQALSHTEGFLAREISLLMPAERVLLVHAVSVHRDDAVEGVVLVFHDITELRRLERVRQEFVANVSHELRTPVASIKGYTETLLDGAVDDRQHAMEFLEIIAKDTDRLARLIEDLLELARIESGHLKMELKSCDLRPVAERVIKGLKKLVDEKGHQLNLTIPKGIVVHADENRVAQVFLNLIDNAIKYTPLKGTITISAEQQGKFVRVEVTDTGIGIPPEDLPRVFERFYRVDKARSRELGGTGLGLAIVKHIVQAHGGEVSVTSTLSEGSSFAFTLPAS